MEKLKESRFSCFWYLKYCPLNEVYEVLKDANVEKLLELSSKIGVEAISRRIGYMLELLEKKRT
ncbi:MAG: hypothetical protein ACUVQ8_02395 [Nitrososphaeria archaeon]